jgi:hypothetical protein
MNASVTGVGCRAVPPVCLVATTAQLQCMQCQLSAGVPVCVPQHASISACNTVRTLCIGALILCQRASVHYTGYVTIMKPWLSVCTV